jgi:Tfp pilus assembly pilus retraction ATPase PilT
VLHPEASPGCASGTKGRVAVMEVLEINFEIQELILKGGSEEQMLNAGRKNGFVSMKEDAIAKALNHVIPYEEIYNFGSKVGEDNEVVAEEVTVEASQIVEVPVDNTESQVSLEV